MGKTLRTIAVLAVATAVAIYAPALSAYLYTQVGVSVGVAAAITAVAAASVTALAGAAINAFAPKPSTTTAPGRQRSRGQPLTQTGLTRSYPAPPITTEMQPIHRHWLFDPDFYPGQRFAMLRVRGSCMGDLVRGYVIVDRVGIVRAGDLIQFVPDDLADYEKAAGSEQRSGGLVKRFIGVDWDQRLMVFETTNPPNRAETGVDRLKSLARVRGTADGWFAAFRLLGAIRRDPGGYDQRLAA